MHAFKYYKQLIYNYTLIQVFITKVENMYLHYNNVCNNTLTKIIEYKINSYFALN